MKSESKQLTSISVTTLLCERTDTTEFSFSTGHAYILDPKTAIQFLTKSPLNIPQEGYGPKLGIAIDEAGSLNPIEGRLSYDYNKTTQMYEFIYTRTDGGASRPQPAGDVPVSASEVSITFNRGSADGIVIVGTVDTVGGDKSPKSK